MDGVGLKRTVMVVDDSEVVLEMTRSALDTAGYHVVTRNRPSGSIAAMLQEEPDLVLVDVSMPGIGGETLVRCFGTAHPTSKTVVLLYSSLPEEALASKAAASGAHGYIQKTHDPARLVRQVRRWLEPTPVSGTYTRAAAAEANASRSGNSGAQSLPLDSARQAAQETGPRVLLADSDMLVLSEYRRFLSIEGARFEFALSGTHALQALTSGTPPDAAVLGLDLGDIRGEDVYERVVNADATFRERVVLVVGPQQEGRVPYFARAVLKRPVSQEALRGAVEQCLLKSADSVRRASG